MLPGMVYSDGIKKNTQIDFKGYNHNLHASEGELWDMGNLTSDYHPLLSPRPPRKRIRTLEKPNGLYAHDELYWVDGTEFYREGVHKGNVTDSRKQFVSIGAYIIILPDMAYYNRLEDAFGNLAASWSGKVSFTDGTLFEEAAEGNSIVTTGAAFPFKVGDAVEISGCVTHPENNKTPVIREISTDGKTLRFYEFAFTTGAESGTVTLSRKIPAIDFICENENRLWGCGGHEIYASKLGDPFNWNVFDGISTDSYAVSVGSAGDFTGCCSYLGYPCFFKEEHIYKVYGDRPSNYQVMPSASLGTAKGSGRSFGIAGEILFYLSRAGIVAYSGGIPGNIGEAFGTVRYKNAVGGSDGRKYYVSMQDDEGAYSLFVFDTGRGIWHREDDFRAMDIVWANGVYALSESGEIWTLGSSPADTGEPEEPVESFAEFGDFYEDSPNRKGISKVQIRLEVDPGAQVDVEIRYDSAGAWQRVKRLGSERKESYYLPVIPRRCDHYRLRITGRGGYRIYSLSRDYYVGSELR